MNICDEILRERWVGQTRCGVVDGPLSLVEAARFFGLADGDLIYRSISTVEADEIAIRVLHAGLAYSGEIMPVARAADLWDQFMALFQGQSVQLATNVGTHPSPWNPANEVYHLNQATNATFDMGVLVLGSGLVGCLWVEEED